MRILSGLLLILAMTFAYGCSGTLEGANKGAEAAGESAGKVLRIPMSAGEGAAGGIKGEGGPNPYNR